MVFTDGSLATTAAAERQEANQPTSTAQPSQSKPGPRFATVAGAKAVASLCTGSRYTLPPAMTGCLLLLLAAAGASRGLLACSRGRDAV